MKLSEIKNRIEEKSIAVEKLIQKLDRENQKKLFKNKKTISDLESKISNLDKEISELEIMYNRKQEAEENVKNMMNKARPLVKKYGLAGCAGLVVLTGAGFVYLMNKPLTIDGENTTYRSMIDSYENIEISSDEYTPETYQQYINSLNQAASQENDLFMSDEEKKEYLEAVSKAYDSLEAIPDKSKLHDLLDEAGNYDVSSYTPESVQKFNTEISGIKSIYDDKNATGKEVSDAEKSVKGAYSLLVKAADKNQLIELYETYSDYDLEGYTPASVKRFQGEIQDSKKLIDDQNISQEKVNEQVETMSSIEELLVSKADKESLQVIIDECKTLNEDDYKDGYSALKTTLTAASTVLNNDNASQEEVDSAVTKLEEARSNLVEYVINVYRVNMHARMLSNNSVGNDWSYARYYNNEETHDGFEVTGEPGSTVNVRMKITESDKSPDVGFGDADIVLEDGYSTSFDVTVREDRGRYSGNTAKFEVTVNVTYLRSE